MRLIRIITYWLLLVVVIAYMISGFGITEFRIVESITFGLFTKRLAFEIHEYLWIPFVVLLVMHVLLPSVQKWLHLTKIHDRDSSKHINTH